MIEVARVTDSACSTEEADWSDGGTKRWSFGNNTNPNMTEDTKVDKESLAKDLVLSTSCIYKDKNS